MRTTLRTLAAITLITPASLVPPAAAQQQAERNEAVKAYFHRLDAASTMRQPCWPVVRLKARLFAIDPATGKSIQLTDSYQPGTLSPDGKSLLSLGSIPEANGFDLFVSDAAVDDRGRITASNTRRITDIDGPVRGGQWMPDGKSVAFIHGGHDDAGLWLIDLPRPGTINTPRRLDAGDGPIRQHVVSGTGRIAYLVFRERIGKEQRLDLMVHDGTAAEPIVRSKFVFAFAWSPDGSRLAYSLINELRIRDIATGEERVVRYADIHDALQNTASSTLAWSPDSAQILAAPRFVGGRRAGTVLFSDDKIVLVPAEANDAGPKPAILTAHASIIGLDWIRAEEVESRRASPDEIGIEAP